MDLMNLPEDPFEKRFAFLKEGIDVYAKVTIDYIQTEYPRKEELYKCLDFLSYNLEQTSRSDFETLNRIWFFPTMEAIGELNESIFKMLLASYKSGYDNLRRVLELVVVNSYFTLTEINAEEAKEWLNSQRQTPMFTRAIKSLMKNRKFNNLESETLWITSLKHYFWHLSDIIHTRGKNFSLSAFQPSNISFDLIQPYQFSKLNLQQLLDAFILTFKHICTLIAVTNPILLIGLPIDEKFGFDTPVSGYFREHQSDDLWKLLIPDTKEHFNKLINTDLELLSISKSINSLPDKTDEEIEEQVEEFRKSMDNMKKGN
jgi:hypothetical protein